MIMFILYNTYLYFSRQMPQQQYLTVFLVTISE